MRASFAVFVVLFVFVSVVLVHGETGVPTPQMGTMDLTSRFIIGSAGGVFPTDTVQVPVYLDTDSLVTQIKNRINWDTAALTFVDVIQGPGAPTADWTLDVEEPVGNEVEYTLTISSSPMAIDDTQPIVYLAFEALCFGYGTSTQIEFDDEDPLFNIFTVPPGLIIFPSLQNGSVGTQSEFVYLFADNVEALPGAQHVTWTPQLYQSTPGRPASITIDYDPAIAQFDSVSPDASLMGGSVTPFTASGTVVVLVNSPVLPAETFPIFTLHFHLVTNDDDFTSAVTFGAAIRVNACGDTSTPLSNSGSIGVPNSTAAVKLVNINKVSSSAYYDVPFNFNANIPVDEYTLYVQYDPEELNWDVAVGTPGYAIPVADTIPGFPDIVKITEGIAPLQDHIYELEQLPANVFKLRFSPVTPNPPVGTTFDLAFWYGQTNKVIYYTELEPEDPLFADITFTDGTITIVNNPPPPGCPTLSVWNGSKFVRENTILAACDGETVIDDVTDFYLVAGQVGADTDGYRFRIREDDEEVSTFKSFELLAVDHPANKPIQIAKDGRLVTVGQPYSFLWAKDSAGRDITALLDTKDDVTYRSGRSGWFDVCFGEIGKGERFASFTSRGPKPPPPADKSAGVEPRHGGKMTVSVNAGDGAWQPIAIHDARINPGQVATLIPPELIEPGRELILRYEWEGPYEIDVLDFNRVEPFDGEPSKPVLYEASHSSVGSVVGRFEGGGGVRLSRGESIDLVFDGRAMPALPAGCKRDFVFVTTGRYERAGAGEGATPAVYALHENVPNPFNPTTLIRYSLARETRVELTVHNVNGALIRRLVSGKQASGEQSVEWDGRSDAGRAVASGVYFYRLKTPEFTQTRKMVLLK